MVLQKEIKKFVKAHLLFILFMVVHLAGAADFSPAQAREIELLKVFSGKSMVLKRFQRVKRVSISDPAIADFLLISPTELYITGKGVGATNMILWYDKGGHEVYDVEVQYDILRLKRQLHDILPDEKNLGVSAMQDAITLSGQVSSASSLSHALKLAKAYAPKGKVHNLVKVGGVQQVMLEVRVAEMQKSLLKRLGVNFNGVNDGGEFGVSKIAGLTDIVKPSDANLNGFGPFSTLVSPAVNALFRFNHNDWTITGFIDALKSDGLVKVLAEPTLIALSGETASFNAGGSYPIPVPQGLGTVAIEYKEYGVGVDFTPTVLADNKINIKVAPEVSELDFATAVQFSGFTIPGLTTRRAATVVELADGQSFAIAGLLRETSRDILEKYPLLGDIPILGLLFRSRSFQKNETELIIIATPRLVKPLDPVVQTLPTDFYEEPSDADFYLFGLMEGRAKNKGVRGKLDGEFGYAVSRNE
jgi:pilus assembly protein CpaC